MAANQIGFRSNLIATIIIFHRLFVKSLNALKNVLKVVQNIYRVNIGGNSIFILICESNIAALRGKLYNLHILRTRPGLVLQQG